MNGSDVLESVKEWFGRFIAVTDPDDLNVLALWTAQAASVSSPALIPRMLEKCVRTVPAR